MHFFSYFLLPSENLIWTKYYLGNEHCMLNHLHLFVVLKFIHSCVPELDVGSIMEEARTRWLRPNEIHAMLCNYKYFTINVKPVNLPKSKCLFLLAVTWCLWIGYALFSFCSTIQFFTDCLSSHPLYYWFFSLWFFISVKHFRQLLIESIPW